MIKIITALGNPNLNYELKEYEEFEVVGKDIQYSEGIIEFLELNNNIDYLIISELLEGNISLINLIDNILKNNKKIKIIIILNEKNTELEDELIQKGINNIFYNKSEITEIINLLKNKNMEILNKELRAEIENLKEIILEKSAENKKKKIVDKRNIIYKTLGIMGCNGIGKTSFCYFASHILSEKYKVLLIDFDLINNDLSKIFKIKKEYIEDEKISIKNLIKKINNNLDIFSNINFLINYKKIEIERIFNEINNIKNNYDFIIIDTNSNIFLEENRKIYNFCEQLVLLADIDELGMNKTEKIEGTLINNFKIDNKKINIMIYKFKKIFYVFCKNNFKKIKNNKNIKINNMYFYNIYFKKFKLIKLKYLTKKKIFLFVRNMQIKK